MPADDAIIAAAARSIASLAPAIGRLSELPTELADIQRARARGYFTPDEDERIRSRFARYLTARAGLLQTIDEMRPIAFSREAGGSGGGAGSGGVAPEVQLRAFTIAYTSAALLIRAARTIVETIALDRLVQRKLNEAEPRFGIPRKQFTAVYQALTNPMTAWDLRKARRFIDECRSEIEAVCAGDDDMQAVLRYMADAEPAIDLPKRRLLWARLGYRWHSLRRRRAAAVGHAMFGIFELAGRIIADLRNPFHAHRVTPGIQAQLAAILQPGDVLISRHDDAMSNLFLPGYWIHASLHIGTAASRDALGVQIDAERGRRWIDPIRVLEARKDGVLFRPLDDTLSVDAVAVIRPRIERHHLAEALARAVSHEGKLYDFEFDFFRSDRLVCTEVVYRGYHGVGPMKFDLRTRAGRPTLSAEDLLGHALSGGDHWSPVAVFGAPGCEDRIATGVDAGEMLRRTLRPS